MQNHPLARLLAHSLAAAALSTLLITPSLLSAQHPYKIIDHWKIGGEGGWDYLLADPPAHRLYITRGPQVVVVDTNTGKQIGVIAGLHGTHGIALDNAGKFGYISDGGGNAVVVFDRATLSTVATVPTGGQGPDGIVFEPATQTVWAFEGRSKDAAVIDAATRKVVALIPLPGKPEFPAVDGNGTVFDNIEDKSELVRLDAHTLKLTATWPLTGCEEPSGLAFDVAGKQPAPVWLTMEQAIKHCDAGLGIWEWASNDRGGEPDVVMACCGDVPTLETLAAVDFLRQRLPEVKIRVINVLDLMKLQPPSEHPHGLPDTVFDSLFTTDKPIIFAFHGYPWLIHRLTYRRNGHANIHVRGYKEEGTTTTPFDMCVINDIDRFHLANDVIDRTPGLAARCAYIKQEIRDVLVDHREYIRVHGDDMPEIKRWAWGAAKGAARAGSTEGDNV